MTLDDLKYYGFSCLNCGNNKMVPAGGGTFAVGIECGLPNAKQLWVCKKEEIRNCKNFITYEQKERQKKINKILKNHE